MPKPEDSIEAGAALLFGGGDDPRAPYSPDQDAIAAACTELREKWSDATHRKRAGFLVEAWQPPTHRTVTPELKEHA